MINGPNHDLSNKLYCDIYRKTFPKGKVTKVPLGNMSLIGSPLQRVAVDLVGPSPPPLDRGKLFFPILVVYATRHLEAVVLMEHILIKLLKLW